MADRLEMLSVEQLNNAVSFVNAVASHGEVNTTTSVSQCLSIPQGKTNSPNAPIINSSPVIISLSQKPSVVNLPAAPRSLNQQNFIQSGTCLPLPVITEEKSVVIGRPVQTVQQLQTIPTYTNCQNSSVLTIPTFTSSQMTSMVTKVAPSNVIPQQQPIQIQSSLVQQTAPISQNISDCFVSSNLKPILPSGGSLFIAEDGTLQFSNNIAGASTQSPVVINAKPDIADQVTVTGKTVCGVQQQQQQPVIVIAPTNSSNTVNTVVNNISEQTAQPTQILYEVRQPAITSAATTGSQTSYTIINGNETLAFQSVSSNGTRPLSVKNFAAQPSGNPAVPSLSVVSGQSKPALLPVATCQGQNILPTIVVKKHLRKCHSGLVLEMVEKIPQVSTAHSQVVNGQMDREKSNHLIATGSYCVECDKMYIEEEDLECVAHNGVTTEISDTPSLSRARISLPGQLQLKQVKPNQVGVFAGDNLLEKTRFGPLVGQLRHIQDDEVKDTPMLWKIFERGEASQVYDCSDEESSNWMRFMRPASSNGEQNVVAYQQGQDIWFITKKDVAPGTELRYWYSYEYAQLLGARRRPSDLFKCGICGKESKNFSALQSHITSEHSLTATKHQCQICAKSFPGKTKLNTHILCHLGVKPFICKICGKQFSDQSNLRLHKNIHTGEKKFQCQICSKAFRQKAHLTTHYLIHSGEKKQQCQFCEKLFARASDLRSHEKAMHTKEKKYVCMVTNCQKVFHKLSVFKKHMLIHTNKKDFSCSICNKTFFTKYHLTRHARVCKGNNKGKKVKDYTKAESSAEGS
uniref:PRDM4 n=1 Tax=Platynereis dumerilii TaxID=6359 RepID=A0A0D6E1P9_PLADU|nr:PRDM4 [Platynereis dumerilii]